MTTCRALAVAAILAAACGNSGSGTADGTDAGDPSGGRRAGTGVEGQAADAAAAADGAAALPMDGPHAPDAPPIARDAAVADVARVTPQDATAASPLVPSCASIGFAPPAGTPEPCGGSEAAGWNIGGRPCYYVAGGNVAAGPPRPCEHGGKVIAGHSGRCAGAACWACEGPGRRYDGGICY